MGFYFKNRNNGNVYLSLIVIQSAIFLHYIVRQIAKKILIAYFLPLTKSPLLMNNFVCQVFVILNNIVI